MRYKLLVLFFSISLFSSMFLFSQEANIDSPDIVLPPMFLEIEDSTVENIETFLPSSDKEKVSLPEIEVELPSPADSDISEEDLESIVLKTEIGLDAIDDIEDEENKDNGIYSLDAEIGFGSLINPFGNFEVSRFSEKHKFVLGLHHDSKDGFGFKPLNSGFSEREENLNFSYTYRDKKLVNKLDFEFREVAFGLQGLSSIDSSLVDRMYLISDEVNFYKFELFDLVFGIDTVILDRRFYNSVSSNLDLLFSPSFVAKFSFPDFNLNIGLDYDLSYLKSTEHFFNSYVNFDVKLPKAVNLAGGLGIFWSSRNDLKIYNKDLKGVTFPFFLTIWGNVSNIMSYKFSGGFENSLQKYSDLTYKYRYLDLKYMSDLSGWFARADFKFKVKNFVNIFLGSEFENKAGYIDVNFSNMNGNGLFDYNLEVMNLLYLKLGLLIKPVDLVNIEIKWKGEVLKDYYALVPEHQLDFLLKYKIPKEWFGGSFYLNFKKYDLSFIPDFGLDMFFIVSDNVEINLRAKDLLASIYKNGRETIWGNYIAPGTNISVSVKLNF